MGMHIKPFDPWAGRTLGSAAELAQFEHDLPKADAAGTPIAWAFRGQPRVYGKLAPAFRRLFPEGASEVLATEIEAQLMRSFRLHYRRIYDSSSALPAPEQIEGTNELACLSIMQHYGVPTRMLDWSSNFWVAVYFACSDAPGADAELWMYNRSIFSSQADPADQLSDLGQRPIVEVAPITSPHLGQQSAHHTVSNKLFGEHATCLRRLAYPSNPDPDAVLRLPGPAKLVRCRRIFVKAAIKPNVLDYLEQFKQINAASIYPDLEGLALFLRANLAALVTRLYTPAV